MTTTEKMDIDERYKYLRIMKPQYTQANTCQEKKKLLDDMEYVTGLHRKHLIQLMRQGKIERRPLSKERGKDYGPEVDDSKDNVTEMNHDSKREIGNPSPLSISRTDA